MKKALISALAIALLASSCKISKDNEEESVIGKPEVKVEDGQFTPEVMWGLGKMGEYAISPDA